MQKQLSRATTLYLYQLLTDYYENVNSIENYFRLKKLEKLSQYGL